MSGKQAKKLRKELAKLDGKQREDFGLAIDTSRKIIEDEIKKHINSQPFWVRLQFAWLAVKGAI